MSTRIACVVLLACAGLAYAGEMGPNLAPNPGFETVRPKGRPAAWSAPKPVYSLAAESARTGSRCLHYENTDAKRYSLCGASVKLEPGKQYVFSVWVRTENVQGKDSGATICIEWSDKDGRFLGGAYPKGVKGTSDGWQQVKGLTRRIPEKAARTSVTCYVRKGMTGKAWWDDVEVKRYQPPMIEALVTDQYRDQTAGGPVRVTAAVNLDDYGLDPGKAVAELTAVDASGKTVAKASAAKLTPTEAAFTLDATPLAPGAYTLTCRVRSTAGKSLGDASCTLTRVKAFGQRKAYIDAHQRLILDGKPFFPLGTYWGSINKKHIDIYATSAFNCMMPYGSPNREQLDLAHANGLKVIYSVKDYYFGTKWCPKHIKSLAGERPAVEAKVKAVVDHPAVMAWYINDELPLTMLDRLAARRDLLEELDPGRPTWVVLYQVGQVRSYLPTFDVIGTDPYPIPRKPASMALDWARTTVRQSFGTRAVWMVPQIFNWASYRKTPEERKGLRPPTLLEMRSMAWQCIAGGANGLVFYSWSDLWRMNKSEPFNRRWADVKQMAAEIRRFFPVLLSAEPAEAPVAVDGPDAVAWRVYGQGGDTVLVAVNSEPKPCEAVFRFKSSVRAADVQLGDGQATCVKTAVRLRFGPLEPKVVRVSFKR